VGRVVGALIGALLLLVIPQKGVSVMFGVMVLVAIGISLAGFHLAMTPKNIFGAGIASGIMGTTSSIGGPPMALVYQRQKGPTIRGTLSGIFIFGTIISLIALAVIGRFGLTEIKAAAVLMPGVVIGFLLSNRSTQILDRGFIRPAVLVTSAISGIVVILRNLL
ncbi:MAG: TSUP family transporter, partial [Candidatus Aminicenantes bacterium]